MLADTGWLLSSNVAIQCVLEREERLSEAAFNMFTRGSFDFVVFNCEDYEPAFVLEVDGLGHANPRQISRDLLKNAFCARAGLPLLRLRTEELRELEDTSVLEWLIGAFVAFDKEVGAGGEEDEEMEEGMIAEEVEAALDDEPSAFGEDGFTFEASHPFPENGVIAARLWERYRIVLADADKERIADARYTLYVGWPGRQPVIHEGQVSRYVVGERHFGVFARNQPIAPVFAGAGRAEFAFEHKMPPGSRARPTEDSEFPWDPWGVAVELAMYDALRQVETWAVRRATKSRSE